MYGATWLWRVIRIGVACLAVGGRLSAGATDATPTLAGDDRVRIAEAFRLADAVGERVWPGWSGAPFALLLVTPEREFLVRHPAPTSDFVGAGDDPLLGGPVWSRPRQFDTGLLASFPAVGNVATIVIGQPANTSAKTSTRWVLTVVHEHFHQRQYSLPGYYDGVRGLDLARGTEGASWMLDYPFPYDTPAVQQQFAAMCARLDEALAQPAGEATARAVRAYLDAKHRLQALVSPGDYKYMNFQLWQEGIARYTEYRVADLASTQFVAGASFAALPGVTSFADEAQALLRRIRAQLTTVSLGKARRTAFYPVGAAEGLLLDRVRPAWHAEYATAGFTLDGLLDGGAHP